MIYVTCLETQTKYLMDAITPYEALDKLKYYLNCSEKDEKAVINKTTSGLHLWMEHNGLTYSVSNRT